MSIGDAVAEIRGTPRPIRRRPKAAVAFGLILIGVAGAFAIRSLTTIGIPNAPEPFDVEATKRIVIPNDQNATLIYIQARQMLGSLLAPFAPIHGKAGLRWEIAPPDVKAWVSKHRPALHHWQTGTERIDAPASDLKGVGINAVLMVLGEISDWGRFAFLEATRLEEEGDLAGAWIWHKARLRACLQISKRGGLTERRTGSYYFDEFARDAQNWGDAPSISPAVLRQAINDLNAMEELHGTRSDSLIMIYRDTIDAITNTDPWDGDLDDIMNHRLPGAEPLLPVRKFEPPAPVRPIFRHAEWFLSGEPERSRRIARLVFANWSAQVDKRPSDRTKLVSNDPPLFGADTGVTPLVAPDELARMVASAPIFNLLRSRYRGGRVQNLDECLKALEHDRLTRANLIVALASRLLELETGRFPASADELIGKTLPKLPDDYVPPDAGDSSTNDEKDETP